MNSAQLTLAFETDAGRAVHGTCPPSGSAFRFFAYSGSPDSRCWARVAFESEAAWRMALWNDSSLYGEHTSDETTWLSELWNKRSAA